MNIILSRTNFVVLFYFVLLLLCSTNLKGQLCSQVNINSSITILLNDNIEVTPASDTSSGNGSQSKTAQITVLVLRRSLIFSPSDVCGGILVSARIVITAAHCFYDSQGLYRKYPYLFRVAYARLDVPQNTVVNGPLAELVVAHPNYNDLKRIDDIGVIRLQKCIKNENFMFSGSLMPIIQKWNNHAHFEILLFSVEDESLKIIATKSLAARLVSRYKCEAAYRRWGIPISAKQICVELMDLKFYHRGESSVLLMDGKSVGVHSLKFDVTSRSNSVPFIYTELAQYSEFIAKEIHNKATLRFQHYRICSSILYVVIAMEFLK